MCEEIFTGISITVLVYKPKKQITKQNTEEVLVRDKTFYSSFDVDNPKRRLPELYLSFQGLYSEICEYY